LAIKLFLPVMAHVTAVGSPSGPNVNSARICGCKRFEELKIDLDQIFGTSLNHSHASLAYPFVNSPGLHCASSRRNALIRLLRRRVQFSPRVPCFPIMEIIDLRKDRRRSRAHLNRPRDTKYGMSQSHDAGKHDAMTGIIMRILIIINPSRCAQRTTSIHV
jgi:hypothetical protein